MTDQRETDRQSALDLLESQHAFPGPYRFRIVIRPGITTSVVSAITAVLGAPGAVQTVDEKASRKGNYISVRITATLPSAQHVLDCYDVIAKLDGVIMTL